MAGEAEASRTARIRTATKLNVIFVAGLTLPAGGARGGQLAAALNLIGSELSNHLHWIPLSSTAATIPGPPLHLRMLASMSRFARFLWALRAADVALLFCANGGSLVEKTLMAILARMARRGVVLRMSGGPLVAECERSRFMRLVVSIAVRAAHVVCSQGGFWTDFFSQWPAARQKIVEAPNPVRVPQPVTYRPTKKLLYTGWVVKQKGVFDLLEAFAAVHQAHPDAVLTMAGSGRDFALFEQAVGQRGLGSAVRLLGWVTPEKVQQELRDADVFVFPSYSEGMPNALLEAMVAGVPVISTPVGSIRDVIRHGENGLLFEPGDSRTMAAHIAELLSAPAKRERLGRAARASVAEHFDVERVWRIYGQAISRAAYESGKAGAVIFPARHALSAGVPGEASVACAGS